MKKIGKFASEVLALIYSKPIGLTAGEAFLLYKKTHPDTDRSRNEVAKRVSELKHKRFLVKKDVVKCCFSGRSVAEWGVTSKGVNYIKKCPEAFTLAAETALTEFIEQVPFALQFPEVLESTSTEEQLPYFQISEKEVPETEYERLFRPDLTDKNDKARLSAYYRFLNRCQNGLPGDELGDWLDAEIEYDECWAGIRRCLDLGYLVQVSVI